MTDSDPATVADSWDTYWQTAASQPAYAGDAAGQPQLVAFWNDYLQSAGDRWPEPRILDIASGNGAVVEQVARVFAGSEADITCLDASITALNALQERFRNARTLQADANEIPLESASLNLVTSQFGIEYAGAAAFGEARRLLRSGGEVAFLMHHGEGVIAEQCRRNREAVEQMQSAQFVPRCTDMFTAGFAMLQGGDKSAYESAGRALAPAIAAMEKIIADFGPETANGTLLRLYRDVRNVHGRMQHHEPAEVLRWLDGMQSEMTAYAGRMTHMLEAALGETEFETLRKDFHHAGFHEQQAGPLMPPDQSAPLAWKLVTRKAD